MHRLTVEAIDDVADLQPSGRSVLFMRVARHHRTIFNEARENRDLACACRRPELWWKVPQVCVCVRDLAYECNHLELVRIFVFRQSGSGNEFQENLTPVLIQDVPIRIPILDDVPKTEETEQLITRIRKFNGRVREFVFEHRISNIGSLRYVELHLARTVTVEAAQEAGQFWIFLIDPAEIRLQL